MPGSADVATNRSIGAIAIKPGSPSTIVIGTAVARHGSSSVNGGRRTPPGRAGARLLLVDERRRAASRVSTDLAGKTPPNPSPPVDGGVDWFQGGITKLAVRPERRQHAVRGRARLRRLALHRRRRDAGRRSSRPSTRPTRSATAPSSTPSTLGGGKTRIYARRLVRRPRHRAGVAHATTPRSIAGAANGGYSNAGWTELSSSRERHQRLPRLQLLPERPVRLRRLRRQPRLAAGVPGHGSELWLGGSMNYDELPGLRRPAAALQRPRAWSARPTRPRRPRRDVTWQDMTATLGDAPSYPFTKGMHPDQHAVVFDSADPGIAFVGLRRRRRPHRRAQPAGQVGGVRAAPLRLRHRDERAARAGRPDRLPAAAERRSRRRVTPINAGLNDIQFQSLSFNPANPAGEPARRHAGQRHVLVHRHRPRGWRAWAVTAASPAGTRKPSTRYHNYYDATPEVNFHGDDPKEWLAIYDPLQASKEARSFYTPFQADPVIGGPRVHGHGARLADRRQRRDRRRTSRSTATP